MKNKVLLLGVILSLSTICANAQNVTVNIYNNNDYGGYGNYGRYTCNDNSTMCATGHYILLRSRTRYVPSVSKLKRERHSVASNATTSRSENKRERHSIGYSI